MSIISNEHQSGSPFECPGCFRARGECECPPRPERQPALPVDLSELDRLCAEHESTGRWMHYADALMNDWPAISAELRTLRARVAALEKLFDDAGQGEHNVLALIDHYQSEAMAESERRRAAEARVKELESEVRGYQAQFANAVEVIRHADRRVADLESQLAAAREAARFFESHMGEWCDECPGNWATDGHVEGCGTGQAYERHSAILEVEAKGG